MAGMRLKAVRFDCSRVRWDHTTFQSDCLVLPKDGNMYYWIVWVLSFVLDYICNQIGVKLKKGRYCELVYTRTCKPQCTDNYPLEATNNNR